MKKKKCKIGGTISELGYKDNSPYKDRKKLTINTPSGLITTEDMAFPILANGIPLYPNTGDYQFNTDKVTEIPMKAKKGGKLKAQNGLKYNPELITSANSRQPAAQINPNNLGGEFDGAIDSLMYQPKNKKFDVGLGIQMAGALYNEFMPDQPNRKYLRPEQLQSYNPNAYGTGSQAIMQDGGFIEPKLDKRVKRKLKGEVPNNYGKYNGVIGEDGKPIDVPTELQAVQTMINYMKNNNPDSNIYRPDFQHHSINAQPIPQPNDNPAYAKNGARVSNYRHGGLQTHEGGSAPITSYNPIDGGMGEFAGNSHKDGGIESTYNGKPFEAEGGEPYRIDSEGSLEIFGNLYNPLTGNKFKKDAKLISKQEKKAQKYLDKGANLVNNVEPVGKYDKLAFNSGRAMLEGGLSKQKQLVQEKNKLSTIQQMLLQENPNVMNNGGIMTFQNGGKVDKYKSIIEKYAKQYGVNPETITSIINTESGFNHKAVSNVGAKGIMQFMPKTAKSYGLTDNSSEEENIAAGVKHFASLLKNNHGDEKLAVAAYNMGQGNLNDFIKSSGKKAANYTGEDLIQRLEWKRKNQPSSKKNLAQNQTYDYLNNITGTKKEPEKFREEYYNFNNQPKNPITPWTPQNKLTKQPPVEPKNYDPLTPPTFNFTNPPKKDFVAPKRNRPWEQIIPVIPQLFDQADPVLIQQYNPDLLNPYSVSFQDRRNQNEAQLAGIRKIASDTPSALGTLGAQAYNANDSVNAEEFRTNQGIFNDITNRNVNTLNDAKLKNLGLTDQQYTRQTQAIANTRDRRTAAGIQIGDILAKNNLENKTLDVTSQLYKNYAYDKDMQLQYVGPEANIGTSNMYSPTKSVVQTTQGNTKTTNTFLPTQNVQLMDGLKKNWQKNYKKDGGKVTLANISKLMYNQ